jgi:hypothetical protein
VGFLIPISMEVTIWLKRAATAHVSQVIGHQSRVMRVRDDREHEAFTEARQHPGQRFEVSNTDAPFGGVRSREVMKKAVGRSTHCVVEGLPSCIVRREFTTCLLGDTIERADGLRPRGPESIVVERVPAARSRSKDRSYPCSVELESSTRVPKQSKRRRVIIDDRGK